MSAPLFSDEYEYIMERYRTLATAEMEEGSNGFCYIMPEDQELNPFLSIARNGKMVPILASCNVEVDCIFVDSDNYDLAGEFYEEVLAKDAINLDKMK